MLLRPRTGGFLGRRTISGEGIRVSPVSGIGFIVVRWLPLLRNNGVAKCSLETDVGVLPGRSFGCLPLRGVAKLSSMNRFPLEAGVLLCLFVPRISSPSLISLCGVPCTLPSEPVIVSCPFRGDSSPSSESRSKRPRTCPSFCGVGPRTLLWTGVKRVLTRDGESYGSITAGCKARFEGVLVT